MYATLVDTAAVHYDAAAIRQYAPKAEELALRHGHTLYLAVTHRAWGVAHRLAGDYDFAATRLNQALEMLAGLDARWQIGRTLYELGQLAAAQGDKQSARVRFSQSLADFEAMRAAPDVAKARAALAELL